MIKRVYFNGRKYVEVEIPKDITILSDEGLEKALNDNIQKIRDRIELHKEQYVHLKEDLLPFRTKEKLIKQEMQARKCKNKKDL